MRFSNLVKSDHGSYEPRLKSVSLYIWRRVYNVNTLCIWSAWHQVLVNRGSKALDPMRRVKKSTNPNHLLLNIQQHSKKIQKKSFAISSDNNTFEKWHFWTQSETKNQIDETSITVNGHLGELSNSLIVLMSMLLDADLDRLPFESDDSCWASHGFTPATDPPDSVTRNSCLRISVAMEPKIRASPAVFYCCFLCWNKINLLLCTTTFYFKDIWPDSFINWTWKCRQTAFWIKWKGGRFASHSL